MITLLPVQLPTIRLTYRENLPAIWGGILFGIQKFIVKHICIDTWLLGPHYGSGKGNFSGVSGKPLSLEEQADLKKQLDDIDIPLTERLRLLPTVLL